MNNGIEQPIEQQPLAQSIVLHLLPGVLIGALFFAFALLAQQSHLPPFMALCLADLIILAPCILGFLFYQGYKRNGRLSLDGVVLYRAKVRWQDYLLFVPVVFLASGLIIVFMTPVSNSISRHVFAWWPAMFSLAPDLGAYSRSTLVVSYVVNLLIVTLAAPMVEEMYFRGYLLPRLSRFGWGAIPINSILFGLFHVWTPWMAVARAIGLVPLILVAQKKQNIYIGMLAHILVNSVDVITGAVFIFKHF